MRVSQSRGMQAERQPRVVSIDTSTFPCTLRKAHVRVSTGSVRPVHTDMYVIRAAARETERETTAASSRRAVLHDLDLAFHKKQYPEYRTQTNKVFYSLTLCICDCTHLARLSHLHAPPGTHAIA